MYAFRATSTIMDMDTLQNSSSSSSSIGLDTSSCSECSLDEKPQIEQQDRNIVENEFLDGVNYSFSDPIDPGNDRQLPKSFCDDYEGIYDFVNEPLVPHTSLVTSLPNVTVVNTIIMDPSQITPLLAHPTQPVQATTSTRKYSTILPLASIVSPNKISIQQKIASKAKSTVCHEQHLADASQSLQAQATPKILQDVAMRTGTVVTKIPITLKKTIDISEEIDAIKTRVCLNCGKMFDSVCEKDGHFLNCAPLIGSNNSIRMSRRSLRKPKLRVDDNFFDCGILNEPVISEIAEPEVLLEVVSLANKTNDSFQSEFLKSTQSQEAAIGHFVEMNQKSNMLKPRTLDASIPVGTSSKTDQLASKKPIKAKPNSRNDKLKPTDTVLNIKSKAKNIPKKRTDKATIADLKKLPEFFSAASVMKKAEVNPSLQKKWGKKKVYLNYSCELCSSAFPSPSKLERHIMSHRNDIYRRFKCNECGKGFIRKDYLMNHFSKVHLSLTNSKKECEGSLKCDHCPTVFKSKSRKTHHVNTNHPSFYKS